MKYIANLSIIFLTPEDTYRLSCSWIVEKYVKEENGVLMVSKPVRLELTGFRIQRTSLLLKIPRQISFKKLKIKSSLSTPSNVYDEGNFRVYVWENPVVIEQADSQISRYKIELQYSYILDVNKIWNYFGWIISVIAGFLLSKIRWMRKKHR